MTKLMVVLALVASGCIEGEDPNSCHVDSDCARGRLCSWMQQCEAPEDLFDLTAHWTLNGMAPTLESCMAFPDFRVGVSGGGSGFTVGTLCADGVVELSRVPTSMTTVKAAAYHHAADGSFTVAGSAEVERGGASEVTLNIVLP